MRALGILGNRGGRFANAAACMFAGVMAAILLGMSSARAHPGTTAFANITLDEQVLHYRLTLDKEALSGWHGYAVQPDAAPDPRGLADAVAGKLKITADGEVCGLQAIDAPTPETDREPARIALTYTCRALPATLSIRDDLPDMLGDAYHTSALIFWPGGSTQFLFESSRRETRIDLASGTTRAGPIDFVTLGFARVLLNPAYLLFGVCLLLLPRRKREALGFLAASVACFGISVLLAAAGWLHLPARTGDALAGLTVAAFAASFLLSQGSATVYAWLCAAGFGLIQGSSSPAALGQATPMLLPEFAQLAEYATAVATAQLLLLLLPLPIALRLRRSIEQPSAARAAALVALAGGFVLTLRPLLS